MRLNERFSYILSLRTAEESKEQKSSARNLVGERRSQGIHMSFGQKKVSRMSVLLAVYNTRLL